MVGTPLALPLAFALGIGLEVLVLVGDLLGFDVRHALECYRAVDAATMSPAGTTSA